MQLACNRVHQLRNDLPVGLDITLSIFRGVENSASEGLWLSLTFYLGDH
jgi:hypothetical protein